MMVKSPRNLSSWLWVGLQIVRRGSMFKVIILRSTRKPALFSQAGGLRGIKPLRKMITAPRLVLVRCLSQKEICIRIIPRAMHIKTTGTARTLIWQAP